MRKLEVFDLPAVKAAMQRMLAKSPAPQMRYANIDVALNYLIYAMREGWAWEESGYLILVSVGSPWYSHEQFLIEDLILKIDPKSTAPVEVAIRGLDHLASRFGVPLTAVGDTQIGYMAPKYEAAGYKKLGTQLYKEHTSGTSEAIQDSL